MAALFLSCGPARAADPAKAADINKLLLITRAVPYALEGLAGMMARSMPREFKPQAGSGPGFEQRLSRALAQVIEQDLGSKLTAALAEIYDQAFTAREVRTLISFYSSPVGRKIIDQTPRLAARSQEAAVEMAGQWAAEFKEPGGAERLKARLEQEMSGSKED